MLLKSRETAIAYRCPYCGMSTISMIGIFTLSGDMFKLKCRCGKSELTATYTSDRKIRLNVPCLICPTPHNYIISSNTFFEKNIFEKKVEKYSKNFQKTVDNVFSLWYIYRAFTQNALWCANCAMQSTMTTAYIRVKVKSKYFTIRHE